MAHGLEVRPPLLDDAMVDRAFSLPSRYKVRRGVGQVPAQARGARQDPRRDHRPPQEGVRDPAGDAGCAARSRTASSEVVARSPVLRSRHPRPRASSRLERRPPEQAGRSQQAAVGAARAGSLVPPQPESLTGDPRMATDARSRDSTGLARSFRLRVGDVLGDPARIASGQLERWLGPTTLASFRGKRVMDVGCGMGRNPYWYVEAGADVGAGRRHRRRQPGGGAQEPGAVRQRARREGAPRTTWIRQVARHLRSRHLHRRAAPPRRARERAASGCGAASRPGGDLVLWCYAKEGNRLMLPVIQSFRALGSRLPINATHAVAKAITALAWPAIHDHPVPHRLLPAPADAVVQERRVDHLRPDAAAHRPLLDARGHGAPDRPARRRPSAHRVRPGQQLVRHDQPNVARSGGRSSVDA